MCIIMLIAAFESMLFPRSIIVEEYYNPATPPPTYFLAQLSTRSHFGIPGLRTFTGRVSLSRFHLGLRSFGDDVYRESVLTAGGHYIAAGCVSFGSELVLYHRSVRDYEQHTSYTINIGTQYGSAAFQAGAWMHNLTVPRFSSIDYIPPCYSVHITYRPEHNLSIRGAVNSVELSMPYFSCGATFAPYPIFVMGVGVNSDPLYIEYSATFVVGALSVQYCGTNHQYLGLSHLFQLTFSQ